MAIKDAKIPKTLDQGIKSNIEGLNGTVSASIFEFEDA
jgi:hypothetical protein